MINMISHIQNRVNEIRPTNAITSQTLPKASEFSTRVRGEMRESKSTSSHVTCCKKLSIGSSCCQFNAFPQDLHHWLYTVKIEYNTKFFTFSHSNHLMYVMIYVSGKEILSDCMQSKFQFYDLCDLI